MPKTIKKLLEFKPNIRKPSTWHYLSFMDNRVNFFIKKKCSLKAKRRIVGDGYPISNEITITEWPTELKAQWLSATPFFIS